MKPGKNGMRWGTDFRETLVVLYKLDRRNRGYVTADDILNELWNPFRKAPTNLRKVILRQLGNFRKKNWAEVPEDGSLRPKENRITKWGKSAARYYMEKKGEEW